MIQIIRGFIRQTKGQDLVEYALLGAFIGLVGVAAFDLIETSIFNVYQAWDAGVQGLWDPQDTLSGGS